MYPRDAKLSKGKNKIPIINLVRKTSLQNFSKFLIEIPGIFLPSKQKVELNLWIELFFFFLCTRRDEGCVPFSKALISLAISADSFSRETTNDITTCLIRTLLHLPLFFPNGRGRLVKADPIHI